MVSVSVTTTLSLTPKFFDVELQMGVGTNFGVRGRRGEAQRAESGGWGSWGGYSQPLPTD